MNVLLNCREWDPSTKKAGDRIGIVFNNVQAIHEVTENDGEPYCVVVMVGRTYFIAGSYENIIKSIG